MNKTINKKLQYELNDMEYKNLTLKLNEICPSCKSGNTEHIIFTDNKLKHNGLYCFSCRQYTHQKH